MSKVPKDYSVKTSVLNDVEHKILHILTSPLFLSEIQRKTTVPRTTTEYNLRKLESKKFIKRTISGKRLLYSKTDKAMKHLENMNYPILELPGITIYQGIEAVQNVWKDILQNPKESRLIGIQPGKSFNEAVRKVPRREVEEVSLEITNRHFIVDAVTHVDLVHSIFKTFKVDAKPVAKAFTKRLEDMAKVPNNFLDEKAEFFLINNDIFIIDWYKEFAVKITNKNIVNLFTSIFYAVKGYGKKYEQGKYIESIISSKDRENNIKSS